jgi:hypothetical protein
MITEIATAVGGVAGIIRPLVERAVADAIDSEHQNNENKIQEAFISRNPDDLWAISDKLLLDAGHPPTPAGRTGADKTSEHLSDSPDRITDGFFISSQLLHCFLLSTGDGVQLRKYLIKAQAKLTS